MRFSIAALVLSFMAAGSSADEQKPFKEPATGLVFPVKLGEWNKSDDHSFGGGLGTCVSYAKGNVKATLFVYNLDLKTIPHDLESTVLKDHFTKLKSELTVGSAERGGTASKSMEEHARAGAGEDAPKFLHALYEIKAKSGKEQLSHLYLSDYKDQFVRIRANYLKENKTEGDKAVEDLMSEVGKLLVK